MRCFLDQRERVTLSDTNKDNKGSFGAVSWGQTRGRMFVFWKSPSWNLPLRHSLDKHAFCPKICQLQTSACHGYFTDWATRGAPKSNGHDLATKQQQQPGTCCLPLQGLNQAAAAAEFQHPLKVESRNEALCVKKKKNWYNWSSVES